MADKNKEKEKVLSNREIKRAKKELEVAKKESKNFQKIISQTQQSYSKMSGKMVNLLKQNSEGTEVIVETIRNDRVENIKKLKDTLNVESNKYNTMMNSFKSQLDKVKNDAENDDNFKPNGNDDKAEIIKKKKLLNDYLEGEEERIKNDLEYVDILKEKNKAEENHKKLSADHYKLIGDENDILNGKKKDKKENTGKLDEVKKSEDTATKFINGVIDPIMGHYKDVANQLSPLMASALTKIISVGTGLMTKLVSPILGLIIKPFQKLFKLISDYTRKIFDFLTKQISKAVNFVILGTGKLLFKGISGFGKIIIDNTIGKIFPDKKTDDKKTDDKKTDDKKTDDKKTDDKKTDECEKTDDKKTDEWEKNNSDDENSGNNDEEEEDKDETDKDETDKKQTGFLGKIVKTLMIFKDSVIFQMIVGLAALAGIAYVLWETYNWLTKNAEKVLDDASPGHTDRTNWKKDAKLEDDKMIKSINNKVKEYEEGKSTRTVAENEKLEAKISELKKIEVEYSKVQKHHMANSGAADAGYLSNLDMSMGGRMNPYSAIYADKARIIQNDSPKLVKKFNNIASGNKKTSITDVDKTVEMDEKLENAIKQAEEQAEAKSEAKIQAQVKAMANGNQSNQQSSSSENDPKLVKLMQEHADLLRQLVDLQAQSTYN